MSQDSHAARPFGRSLGDFGELSPAEQKLLDKVGRGEEAKIGNVRPDTRTDENSVRAGFVRFLVLGGDERAPVHERGVRLRGAFIEDKLDLGGATTVGGMTFMQCHFKRIPRLVDALVKGSLSFSGSWLPGVEANSAAIYGTLSMGQEFVCRGLVQLMGARIDGNLVCNNGKFINPSRDAFNANRIFVGGSIFMRNGFKSAGVVRLANAKIGVSWNCDGGVFSNPGGVALSAGGIDVGGSIFMGEGFETIGDLRLFGGKIAGNWFCNGGLFSNVGGDAICADAVDIGGDLSFENKMAAYGEVRLIAGKIHGDLNCATASFDNLFLDRLIVDGTFYFDRVKKISGLVSLLGTRVWRLVDDLESWPAGNTILDGFVHSTFAGVTPVRGERWIRWLELQIVRDKGVLRESLRSRLKRWGCARWTALRGQSTKLAKAHADAEGFKPQPWIQARKVLREMGHYEAAREVGIAFETRKRRIGLIGGTSVAVPWWCPKSVWPLARRVYRVTAERLHWGYGATVSYGYRPLKLLFISLLVWGFCTGLFYWGGAHGFFAPTDPLIYQNPAYAACVGHWTNCSVLNPAYTTFYAPVYSLNVLLPVGDLGQASSWAPMTSGWGLAVQVAVWFETLFGWVAGLLLIAVVSGLVKRDE